MAHYQYNSESDSQDCVSLMSDISGANTTNYSLEQRTRDFNAGMDLYYSWAFEADGRWNYDDVNETTPPIDEQNIVSGTNRYKIGTFTEKVIKVIRVEILTSAAEGRYLEPETFGVLDRVVNQHGSESGRLGVINHDTFQSLYIDANSGTPSHYCKYGDFIYLRPKPDYSEADGLKIYFNRPATYMASNDTTDVPGVVLTHIPIVCELAANRYKLVKGLMSLSEKIAFEEYAKRVVQDHFATRDKDIPRKMTPKVDDTK